MSTLFSHEELSRSKQEVICLQLERGKVLLDSVTLAPVQFVGEDPKRVFLLDDRALWHSPNFQWGAGSITTNLGSTNWLRPSETTVDHSVYEARFDLIGNKVTLVVKRAAGRDLIEEYVWSNNTSEPLTIERLTISAPFNDQYPDCATALDSCVNAHIFTGGAVSWVIAEPMDGVGKVLGLTLREGELNAYSIYSRNHLTSSDVRGHIALQPTDYGVNPNSFGGQKPITIPPGESYTLSWNIDWFDDREQFAQHAPSFGRFSSLSSETGTDIELTTESKVSCDSEALTIVRRGDAVLLTSQEQGTYHIKIDDGRNVSHTEVFFHHPLRDVINRRVSYILSHQIAQELPGTLAGSIVSADTRTGRHVVDGSWADWSDGSERTTMPILLQRALRCDILSPNLAELAQEASDNWRAFALEHLISEDGKVRRSSSFPPEAFGERLYDVPWMAQYFIERFTVLGTESDLEVAIKLFEAAHNLGWSRYLCIGFAEATESLVRLLRKLNREQEADLLTKRLLESADYFLALDKNLPAHEVAYEQSIVAPLVSLLITAYRFTANEEYLRGIKRRLPWLLSFSGPQPDSRLFGIGIRHWDGYWFGLNRQFGDVFPHHWSALTAEVLLRLPQELRSNEHSQLAMDILNANLAHYNQDGSATCAFVFPSSVDDVAAHSADPLANDQDWPLSIWLRLIADEGIPWK